LAAGFAGLALWRFAETVYGQAGPGGQAVSKRLVSLALGVLYGSVCGIVVDFILGVGGSTSSDTESKSFTARLLAHSGGQTLVAVIGVAAAAVGVGVGVYGLRRTFATYLCTAQMRALGRKVVEGLGVAGYVTRGVVFCVVGAFLIDAAVTFDPQKAQGLDGSLRKTAATPLGPWLRTGDLGTIYDGELFIIGRIKDLLIVYGRNHAPDDIEATIQDITRSRCVAIGVPDDGIEKLVAIIELKQHNESDEDRKGRHDAVKREVTAAISTQHGLSAADLVLVTPGSLPITTSGKVRRRACVELYRHDNFARLDV